ncbi:DUF3566 domain-containing protein [Gordonia sp. PKS22-38]|uniref:DUF3566 domain-containing protein n=1 Tax=Gordonia prachuapensis TaxID=3115651 RepID=A0ABU7MYQ7_9ACTN|nr:DUF3566 domain-containing protein [Gordonia sp. PKS22-38]
MSSPNTPDDKKPSNGDSGPHAASGPGQQGTAPGGLVPPWQRGPNGAGHQSDAPNGSARQPGPPPRGIVTAAASMAGQQAPITKLDDPREAGASRGGTTTKSDTRGEKFVESPTRNIDRGDLPAEELPNLDAIHHVNDPAPAQTPAPQRSAPAEIGARPLRAAVQLRRIDPWATFKVAAVLSVAGFLIWMISIAVLYLILDGMGVWDQVNSSFGTLVTADGSTSEGDIIGAGTVFGWATLIGAINAILLTALATVGAYIYNLCADLVGGAEVTLADLD